MKRTKVFVALLFILSFVFVGAACAAEGPETWIVGFSQIGAESEWRNANTFSVQHAIGEDPTFLLVFSDAQQKQENQIKALRSFIARGVDVIAFTALVETGYGPVLQEAKDAGIPVIMIDRDVAVEDRHLRLTIMGSDFVEEGRKAANWLAGYLKEKGLDDGATQVNIVELQGTVGSAPAIERKQGFEEIMNASHPNWAIVRSQTGNFTRSEGKAVMEAFLKAERNIDVLYAHNDDMALGAIQAIEEAGLKPGVDIIIIGVDAVKGAFAEILAGRMNVTVECSP
ncbi:MAG TPA: LacI family transcriptional regulator, partial [Firmicutes bacterium]|nr:LacI family transcriptional regulator [Bacillota bacterium]